MKVRVKTTLPEKTAVFYGGYIRKPGDVFHIRDEASLNPDVVEVVEQSQPVTATPKKRRIKRSDKVEKQVDLVDELDDASFSVDASVDV